MPSGVGEGVGVRAKGPSFTVVWDFRGEEITHGGVSLSRVREVKPRTGTYAMFAFLPFTHSQPPAVLFSIITASAWHR